MGKKLKAEENTSSDIFRQLFGGSSKGNTLSLFTDEKFRRKAHSDVVSVERSTKESEMIDEKIRSGSKKRKKDRTDHTLQNLEAQNIDTGDRKTKKKRMERKDIGTEQETKPYGESEKKNEKEENPLLKEDSKFIKRKDKFDDESKLQRTIFVGNLPLKVKKKQLLKEFGRFGEVESVRIRSIPILDSKKPRKGAIFHGQLNDSVDSVHAYVVFKDEKSTHAALSNNMAMIEGNHIRVDIACPPRKKIKGANMPIYDNKRTVFIGNLPFDVKDEELYQLFCGIKGLESSLEAVRVVRDPNTSAGKGIAYALFKTREAANSVVNKKQLQLRDRTLRLYHAKSEPTSSKKEFHLTAQSNNFPPKRPRSTIEKSSNRSSKSKIKANHLSYQGLKASKSGFQKKSSTSRPTTGDRKVIPKGERSEQKVRQNKRPSVAARKASSQKLKTSIEVKGHHALKNGKPNRKRDRSTNQRVMRPSKKAKRSR